jgi:hypothetical protein
MHIVLGVPSEPVTSEMIAVPEFTQPVDPDSGYWRVPWSPKVQAHWLEAAYQIALSKSCVESVSWTELMDHPTIELPMSGLINEDFQPKFGFKNMMAFKKNLYAAVPTPTAGTKAAMKDLPPETKIERVDPG